MDLYELVRAYLWILNERPSHFARRAEIDNGNFSKYVNGSITILGPKGRAKVKRAMLNRPPDRHEIISNAARFFYFFDKMAEEMEGGK